MQKEEQIAELKKLITPEGFKNEILHSEEIWRSDPELMDWIFAKMNSCTTQIIKALENNSSQQELKSILKTNLRGFKRIDFDTEDAEFVTDCFEVLSTILNIRFGDNLMRWLYGPIIWLMVKVGRFLRPEKTIAKKTQACTNCGASLSIEMKRSGSGRESDWIIGKCLSCNEYNLIESFADSRRTSFSNYYPSDHLSKDEFTEEQAKIRLEQIKYWRK